MSKTKKTNTKVQNNENGEKRKKRGFTLVEILIVVAVIGILFVALVPKIDFAGDKARETGVKTDFRSFELAAEQVLRENAGLADFDDTAALCSANGINLYLDEAMKFTDGSSAKEDLWNQNYTMQVVKPETGNENNGAIIFISNGKDSVKSETADNYALVVSFVDGVISTETVGFSSNIESNKIADITADTAASMSVDTDKVATVVYAK